MSFRTFIVLGAIGCALASTGCSEAVPPASQGAFTAIFSSVSNLANHTCDKDIHTGQIGYADATEIRDIKKDGVAGALVYCAVETAGDGFNVEAEIRLLSTTMRINIDNIKMGATEAAPAPGGLSYKTQQTVKVYTAPADRPCQFWFVNDQQIAAGRIWAQFKCDVIQNASTASACTLTSASTIAFQNCDQ